MSERASRAAAAAVADVHPAPRAPRLGLSEVVDLIADALIERMVPRIAASQGPSADEVVDQVSAPCERARYLKAARLGRFPSYRHGKRVFARRADVLAWLLSGGSQAKPTVVPVIPGAGELDDQVRRKLGLKTRSGGRA